MTSARAILGACAAAMVALLGAGCADRPRPQPPAEPEPAPRPESAAPVAVIPSPPPDPTAPPEPQPIPTPPAIADAQPTAPQDKPPAAAGGLHEIFPGVRVNAAAKIVEFDGEVPIDVNDADAPLVYLELVACTPDTREHESLVMTRADAAHVHAALLLIGLEPGKPGSWAWDGRNLSTIPPTGPALAVEIITRGADGAEIAATPESWIISARDRKHFGNPGGGAGGWVFAGSMMRVRQGREVYEAQGAGTLIGLTTFGSETIAWRSVISPEAAIDEPEWIADKAVVPKVGTPVTVRIRPK